MSRNGYDNTGKLVERWDDATRKYTDFRTDPDTVRDYTPEENANADIDTVVDMERSNALTIEQQVQTAVVTNRQIVTQLNMVANGAGALTNTQRDQYIRQLAGYQARAFQQINALARLVVRDFSGTD